MSPVTSPSPQKLLVFLRVSGTENSNEYPEFASASHPCPFYWFVLFIGQLRPVTSLRIIGVYSVVVVLLWLMLFLV